MSDRCRAVFDGKECGKVRNALQHCELPGCREVHDRAYHPFVDVPLCTFPGCGKPEVLGKHFCNGANHGSNPECHPFRTEEPVVAAPLRKAAPRDEQDLVTDAQAKAVCDALGVDDSYTDELQPLLEKWLNGESSTEFQLRTMLRVMIADMRAMLDDEPHFANIHTGRPVRATAIVSVIQNLSMTLAGLDYRNCEASSAWHDRNAAMFEYALRSTSLAKPSGHGRTEP